MGRFLKNIKKQEKYSFISEDELKRMNDRGIELKNLVDNDIKNKDYKSARDHSVELANIIKELRKYKKYAKK